MPSSTEWAWPGPWSRRISSDKESKKDTGKVHAGGSSDPAAFTATVEDLGCGPSSNRAPKARSPLLATMTLLQDDADLIRDTGIDLENEIAPFSPGYLLAQRWKIVERIGKGGFGFVYSALDTELEVTVAIKVLRPEHETSAQTIAQFKQEIQLARQVTHKNVCRIYDVGFYEQGKLRVPFLTMELLAGQPLDERLEDVGALTNEELEAVALQVSAALEAAHNAGIVHADLKPANIMVDGAGASLRTVVADFGLASAYATARRKEGESRVVGTPAYMAPEQVEGEELGPAADFYALGCTLYHIISGHLPFYADTPITTARARLAGPPPNLGETGKTIPSRWVALVRDLMALDPALRLASAAQIRKRLRRPRRGRYLALTMVALALLASLTANFLGSRKAEPDDLVLSLPKDKETLRLYQIGLKQWEDFNVVGAVETWQGAIDSGHRHARLYMRLCHALGERSLSKRKEACVEDAYQASRALGKNEQDFYDAYRSLAQNKTIEATQSLSDLLSEHPGNYEIRRLLAQVMRGNGEFQAALDTLHGADTDDTLENVRLDSAATEIYIDMMQYDKAIEIAERILPVARTHKLRREELLIMDALAHAHQNLGNLDKTEALATETVKSAGALGFVRLQAEGVSHLSAVAIKRGQFTRAAEFVALQRSLLEVGNDLTAAARMSVTSAENMAATGQPQQAYELLTQETIPRLRKDNNTYWEAYAIVVRAEILGQLSRFDEAIADCASGASLSRSLKKERLQSYAQVVCADNMLAAGRLDEARELLVASRETRTRLALTLNLLQNSLLDGELLLKEGQPNKAFEIAKGVAGEYVARKLPHYEVKALNLMARSALAQGDQEAAETAVARAQMLGTEENIELEIARRFTELQVQSAASSRSTVAPRLENLRTEASALGYHAMANQISATLEAGVNRRPEATPMPRR